MKKLLLFCVFPIYFFGQDYFYPPEKMNLSLQERFGSVFNNPEFYPIGWSDDGLFAYKMIYNGSGYILRYNQIHSIRLRDIWHFQ